MKCPKCKVDMVIGQAIKPSYDENALHISPPKAITYQTMKIVTCFKCPKCGHSDDNVLELK